MNFLDNLKGKIDISLEKDKILKASSGIDIEWERAITSFSLAHLNYTDLLDSSVLFKINHSLLPMITKYLNIPKAQQQK